MILQNIINLDFSDLILIHKCIEIINTNINLIIFSIIILTALNTILFSKKLPKIAKTTGQLVLMLSGINTMVETGRNVKAGYNLISISRSSGSNTGSDYTNNKDKTGNNISNDSSNTNNSNGNSNTNKTDKNSSNNNSNEYQINKIKVQSKNLNNKDHLFGRLSPRICSSSPDFVVAGKASGKRRLLRIAKVLISGDARTALVRQPR